MSYPKRPNVICANASCRESFHPNRSGQRFCCKTCSALQRHREHPELRQALRKGQATVAQARRERVQQLIAGCQTKAQAFLLGVKYGINRGWWRRWRRGEAA